MPVSGGHPLATLRSDRASIGMRRLWRQLSSLHHLRIAPVMQRGDDDGTIGLGHELQRIGEPSRQVCLANIVEPDGKCQWIPGDPVDDFVHRLQEGKRGFNYCLSGSC
jgi:hypothetical protein